MPTARRSRTLAAPPERVWGIVGDPHHLPRWWPRVTRVEAVTDEHFTEVLTTEDGRSLRADFRVVDPLRAVVQVENYLYATSQEAQTTLRSILGGAHLDELLSERERLAAILQEVIDLHTDPWGVKVSQVAVKAVDLPPEMVRAMAKQAESEREKRAKVIHASGEFEASKQLTQAAAELNAQPVALHLRYLQTLVEIAAEKNSTIIFPVPVDLLRGLLGPR
jgi:regulator of protease activity HflC (stomatin/prohibitin superfamily)